MNDNFSKVKNFILDLDLEIIDEIEEEEIVIIKDLQNGINNLVIDCEWPIIILEQIIMKVKKDDGKFYKRLLEMNRQLVHGAFVLDDDGQNILFRDTLQLENLDENELEGSIQSLSLAMAEFGNELLEFSKQN